MLERLKELIKNLLKIPPQPEAPFGAPGSVRIFRAAPGFFRYRMLAWSLRQLGALLGIILVLQFVPIGLSNDGFGNTPDTTGREEQNQDEPFWLREVPITIGTVWAAFEILAIISFVVQLPFTFLMVFLDYDYRWYVITDRSLRIREGLLRVDERTMTFSNIQNVSIRQGPLQRLLGISDVEVSAAGGGSGSDGGDKDLGASIAGALQAVPAARNLHQAYFRGIDNPAGIRDAILVHLRGARASGLGDPDEEHEPLAAQPDGAGPGVLEAARGLLAEARALRQAVS
jgi:membrane protein YdbS with pleckstrin-like domain